MKKVYIKPEIMFESFAMSTSIAANCAQKIETQNSGQCGLQMGALTIFLENVSGCSLPVVDGSDQYDGICYDVPTDSKELFNS